MQHYPFGKLLTETDYAEDRVVDGRRCILIRHRPTGLEVVCNGTGKKAWSLGMEEMDKVLVRHFNENALLDSMRVFINPCPV